MISKISVMPQENKQKIYKASFGNKNIAEQAANAGVKLVEKEDKNIPFFYKNPAVKKILEMAEDHNLIFSAGFALILTCILRPASIVALPSKKNQDDQKYAAAQSIASGVIGFALSLLIFKPFQDVSKNLKDLAKTPEKLNLSKNSYLLKDSKKLSTAMTYLERLPDIAFAAPKGILTVALIPPILKYVFKMEKKPKTDEKAQKPIIDYGTMNFKSSTNPTKRAFMNFEGGAK